MPWKPQRTANGISRKTAYYLGGLAIRALFLCLIKYRHECRCSTTRSSSALDAGEWAASSPGRSTTSTLNRRLRGPQSQSGYAGVEKSILPCQESCWTEVVFTGRYALIPYTVWTHTFVFRGQNVCNLEQITCIHTYLDTIMIHTNTCNCYKLPRNLI